MHTLSAGAHSLPHSQTNAHAQWLSDIINHLRDDLILLNKLPSNYPPSPIDIQIWVMESYCSGLAELEWQQAVTSLLLRIRAKGGEREKLKQKFVGLALTQLQRALGPALSH